MRDDSGDQDLACRTRGWAASWTGSRTGSCVICRVSLKAVRRKRAPGRSNIATAPIRRAIENFQHALEGAKIEEAFMTAVAPASTAYGGVNECYPSEKEYVFALAEALGLEIHKAGLLLQVDDAVLANMYNHLVQQSPEKYREWAQLRVDTTNHAVRDIPEDRIGYHVCFGSWHVPHLADAPLEELAGAYSIEAAYPRHEHEWRVLEKRKLPGRN